MSSANSVLCIGSALWDIIARASRPMRAGSDVPGRIERQLGGVALNIALALSAQGQNVTILTALGRDDQGDRLIRDATARGVDCSFVTRVDDPTDTYLAIEDPKGEVFGAVADCDTLEKAGETILAPLRDGRLGDADNPFTGTVVIDGNLSAGLLTSLARHHDFRAARLSFVPASPGKAERLREAIRAQGGTVYVNLREAEILCLSNFRNATEGAAALVMRGAARAIVTNGRKRAALACSDHVLTVKPPVVETKTTTGAGDCFVAAHIAAEIRGLSDTDALSSAIDAATQHISGG